MSGIDGLSRTSHSNPWENPPDCERPKPKASPAPWDLDMRRVPEAVRQYDPSMFSNPALTRGSGGGTSTNTSTGTAISAPIAASAPSPPPPPRTSPGIPASAPNAYRGIQLRCIADDLPHVTRTATDRPIACGTYKLYPALARQADGSEALVFWTAVNTQTKRGEFVVGPESLTRFMSAPDLFEIAAANAYLHGEPNSWERESMKAVDAAMRKGPLAALPQLGKAWVEAVKDPEWWMHTAAAAGGAAQAAEGAAARAGRPPASQMGRSTEIVPGGGLAAHEGGAANGHLIGRHVAQTDAQLVERANTPTPPKKPGRPPGSPPLAVSTFYDRGTAEVAASRTIAANEAKIQSWLATGGQGNLVIEDPTRGAPVGRSVNRWGQTPTEVAGTKLVLVGDRQKACGFRILTGYPVP